MVKFTLRNSDLIAFLERCTCKGVVLITSTEKSTKNFFDYFYMDIIKGDEDEEGYIQVKAIDSEERRMFIKHTLNNVDVEKAGRFAVTDADLLLSVLKSIPSTREIVFQLIEEGAVLKIETKEGKPYFGAKIRQVSLQEDLESTLESNNTELSKWDSFNSFDEEAQCPKYTVPDGTALFNTKVILNKQELLKILKDSISLTKDQDLKVSMSKVKKVWCLKVVSGKKADDIIMTAEFDKTIENPIPFEDMVLTNLHPIIGHLFNESTFYFRIAGDGALKFWVTSEEGNIELNFNSSST
jgi:hypothetical protein